MSSFFNSIWGIIAIPLGFIMRYCYILFEDVLHFPLAYVFALLLFTLVTKAILFPLAVKQQRSSATMALYQPLIEEINTKYAKDPTKKSEELQKLQEEYGYSPTAGCLPLFIQFPILFGLIEVIYKPLTYMIRIPSAVVTAFSEIVSANASNTRLIETAIIEAAKTTPDVFTGVSVEGYTAAQVSEFVQKIADINMSIGSINLWETPKFAFTWMLLIPLFSVVTMLLSQFFTMRNSGTANAAGNSMMTMTVVMSLMFAWFSFMYPAGFSLYWGFQNLISIGQSFILRRIVNVDKLREEKQKEIEEKRRQRKEKKTVAIKNASGDVENKDITPQELARIRLQKAREIDAARYESNSTEKSEEN